MHSRPSTRIRVFLTQLTLLLGAAAACDRPPTAPPATARPAVYTTDGAAMRGPMGVAITPRVAYRRLTADELTRLRASRGGHATASGGGTGALAALSGSVSQFAGFWRYPAEEQQWTQMANDTAYSRDVFVSGDIVVYDAQDGETWDVQLVYPDGRTLSWPTITFHAVYQTGAGEQRDCFVSSGWYLCGSTSIWVQSYVTIQCSETGTFTMVFKDNGTEFHRGTFTLKPQIRDGAVQPWNQIAYDTDPYARRCWKDSRHKSTTQCLLDANGDVQPGQDRVSIRAKGCAMTTIVMALRYHGMDTDPVALNAWLTANGGFSNGSVKWSRIPLYASSVFGKRIEIVAAIAEGDTLRDGTIVGYDKLQQTLEASICKYGPQSIRVANPHPHEGAATTYSEHWVSATGQDYAKTTYLINDPNGYPSFEPLGGKVAKLADKYSNHFSKIIGWSGGQQTYTDPSGLEFFFHSPGEMLLTDPLGRRVGKDPNASAFYGEIPNSNYSLENMGENENGEPIEDEPTKDLLVLRPMAGAYTMTVTGTGTGTYTLDMNAVSTAFTAGNAEFVDVPITPGEVHRYSFNYDPAGTAPTMTVGGGFRGGGQGAEVDSLLTYMAPGSRSTTLPAGTTSYGVMIAYSPAIDPATFHATLDNVDVTGSFHPVGGRSERVALPLHAGRNVLLLTVDGRHGSRMSTDRDHLTFVVQ